MTHSAKSNRFKEELCKYRTRFGYDAACSKHHLEKFLSENLSRKVFTAMKTTIHKITSFTVPSEVNSILTPQFIKTVCLEINTNRFRNSPRPKRSDGRGGLGSSTNISIIVMYLPTFCANLFVVFFCSPVGAS